MHLHLATNDIFLYHPHDQAFMLGLEAQLRPCHAPSSWVVQQAKSTAAHFMPVTMQSLGGLEKHDKPPHIKFQRARWAQWSNINTSCAHAETGQAYVGGEGHVGQLGLGPTTTYAREPVALKFAAEPWQVMHLPGLASTRYRCWQQVPCHPPRTKELMACRDFVTNGKHVKTSQLILRGMSSWDHHRATAGQADQAL